MQERVPRCPRCEQEVTDINWRANLRPTRLDENGQEIPYWSPDRMVNVGEGIFSVLPCGHSIDRTQWQALAALFQSAWKAREVS